MTLPAGWVDVSLEDVCKTINTGRRPKGGVRGISDGVLSLGGEHVGADGRVDLTTPRFIPPEFAASLASVRILPHDILLVKDGATTGKVALADLRFENAEAYPNEHVFVCRAALGVAPNLLFAFLRSEAGRAAILSDFRGAAQGGISRQFSNKVLLPLAPQSEQRRIVAKLDVLLARLVRARAELDRVDARAKSLRSKLLELEFDLSHEDSTVPLSAIASIISGNTFKSADFTSGPGIALVRIGNIFNGTVDIENSARLPVEFFERYTKFSVVKNDILVALSGATTGKSGLFSHNGPALLNQRVARIRIVEPAHGDAEYVRRFTEFHSARILEAAYGAAQPNISHNRLKELRIYWPNAEARRARSSALFARLSRADRLQAEAARARMLLDRLETAVLAKAFRGELVPQDPTDEPAQALLDRICSQRPTAPKSTRGRRT